MFPREIISPQAENAQHLSTDADLTTEIVAVRCHHSLMVSQALRKWHTTRANSIDRLLRAHHLAAQGSNGEEMYRPDLVRELFDELGKEFEEFCRDLYDECTESFIDSDNCSDTNSFTQYRGQIDHIVNWLDQIVAAQVAAVSSRMA